MQGSFLRGSDDNVDAHYEGAKIAKQAMVTSAGCGFSELLLAPLCACRYSFVSLTPRNFSVNQPVVMATSAQGDRDVYR